MGFIETAGDLPTGTVILGKYRIDGVLGSGGMGIVYAAHHVLMDQRVALKLLLPEALSGEGAVTRFITEARHAAKIPGDNVCRILDVGLLESGLPYIAMEYLEGRSLDAICTQWGAILMRDAARWILEAVIAVAHAHARGIVHRDLKPSNLFLAAREDGSTVIKVLDFGISRSVDSAQHKLTSTRAMLGSPGYISPEHIRNSKTADPRSDIWSLGVVLYELVATKSPFDTESLVETIAAILETEPAPLTSTREVLPAEFCAVVQRCLAKDRDARFQDVGQLAQALAPFAGSDGPALAERAGRALVSVSQPHASLVDDVEVALVGTATSSAPPGGPSTGRLWTSQSTVSTTRTRRRRAFGAWAAATALLCGAVLLGTFASRFVRGDSLPAAAPPSAAVAPVASSPPAPPPSEAPPAVTSEVARPPPTASVDSGQPPSHRPPRPSAASARPTAPVVRPPSPLSTSRD